MEFDVFDEHTDVSCFEQRFQNAKADFCKNMPQWHILSVFLERLAKNTLVDLRTVQELDRHVSRDFRWEENNRRRFQKHLAILTAFAENIPNTGRYKHFLVDLNVFEKDMGDTQDTTIIWAKNPNHALTCFLLSSDEILYGPPWIKTMDDLKTVQVFSLTQKSVGTPETSKLTDL